MAITDNSSGSKSDLEYAIALTMTCKKGRMIMDLPDFLTRWPNGEIILTGHRIGLYSVIDLSQRGFSPDQICAEFPTLTPELIRSVLEFHEAHRSEVEAYVDSYRTELDRQEAASRPSPAVLRIRRLMDENTGHSRAPSEL
jgi:uncharacterized protein (DUF433 family)